MTTGRSADAHIELLGHIAVRSDKGHSIVSGKPATILATLALRSGPVSVARLVELLWSDPPEKEINALQRHVSRLRSVLADHDAAHVVSHAGSAYELDRRRVTVDVDQLEARPSSDRTQTFPVRWWLEPLVNVDHTDFIVERRRLERLCHARRRRALAANDISPRPQLNDVPVEVVRELRRWLELRAGDDEARRVVHDWLAQVETSTACITDRTG